MLRGSNGFIFGFFKKANVAALLNDVASATSSLAQGPSLSKNLAEGEIIERAGAAGDETGGM